MKPLTSLFIRLVVTSLILTFLFLRIDFSQVLSVIRASRILPFLLGFTLFISTYFLGICRWMMLLSSLEIRPALSKIITAYCGGLFFNMILPSTIGGDIARAYSLFPHTKESAKLVATVMLDRLSGFLALTFIAIISYQFGSSYIDSPLIGWTILIISCMFISISLLLFSRRISAIFSSLLKFLHLHRIEALWLKIFKAVSLFKNQRKVLLKIFLLSLLIQGAIAIVFYFITYSLGASFKIIHFFIIVPIVGVISTIPITIAGLGLRDFSAILFFSKIGIPKAIAFSASLISFFFTILVGVTGGIIYVLTLRTRRV